MISFLSLQQVKKPNACSSDVVADDRIASMVNSSRSDGILSVLKQVFGWRSLDIAQRECMSSVGTDVSMSSSV